VEIRTGAAVESLLETPGRVTGVRLRGGELVEASHVLLAVSAAAAARLLPRGRTRAGRFAEQAAPVRAACLNVSLRRLPAPRARFALGMDQPLYFSVHSASARLAPAGGAVVHAAKYLDEERLDEKAPRDAAADRRELEGMLDLLQPSWRDEVVEARYYPALTVATALDEAAQGGALGRPSPAVAEIAGLYVAGDWVGAAGMLADASLASAALAADLILAQPVQGTPRDVDLAHTNV
jgi:phytoene dehydrogenase-like protein